MTTPRHPWMTIWLRPRATMRAVLDRNPERLVLVLGVLWGFAVSVDTAMAKSPGDRLTVPLILALAAIFAPSTGLAALYIMGLFLTWAGRLIGGQGKARELRAAFAWSSIPRIASLLLLLPAVLLFGSDLFTSETPYLDAHPALYPLFYLYLLASAGLAGWGIVTFIKCVAEAHRFSSWRALLTVGAWLAFLGLVFLAGSLVSKCVAG